MISFDKMTFGDWISFNSRLSQFRLWNNPLEYFKFKLGIVIIFEKSCRNSGVNNDEFDYSKQNDEFNKMSETLSVEYVNRRYDNLIKWRSGFFDRNEDYFGKSSDIEEETEKKTNRPDFGTKFDYSKWQYHLQILKLCESYNYKPDDVYSLNIIYTFSTLTFLKQLDEEKNRILNG